MKVVEPYTHILETGPTGIEALKIIERAGRISWKSEGKTTEDSCFAFVRMLIKAGHESVLEHVNASVLFVIDRGVSHELVRHRIAAFTQESTRYCNYNKTGEVVFIKPMFWPEDTLEYRMWHEACEHAEQTYLGLINMGAKPQEARSVLPNSLKTEIQVTANLREWRHIFTHRAAPPAHPQMREVMVPLLYSFQQLYPVVFEDLSLGAK